MPNKMEESHFRAEPITGGFSWTLTTRLGSILREVEQRYGRRDQSWTILGVEFSPAGPQIWYPGNCQQVAIQLGLGALGSTSLACYQIAHECVHLLAPTGGRSAPVIEEGLATVFAEDYVKREFCLTHVTQKDTYRHAADLVRHLLAAAPDAIDRLRAVQSSFARFTHETFVEANLAVPSALEEQLLRPF